MLDVKTWVAGKLAANAPLLALVGDASHIAFGYPRDFVALPKVTYSELNQPTVDDGFFDNKPSGYLALIEVDVWAAPGALSPIVKAVDVVMLGLYFSIIYSADVPDPDAGIAHRCMRYRRLVQADSLS